MWLKCCNSPQIQSLPPAWSLCLAAMRDSAAVKGTKHLQQPGGNQAASLTTQISPHGTLYDTTHQHQHSSSNSACRLQAPVSAGSSSSAGQPWRSPFIIHPCQQQHKLFEATCTNNSFSNSHSLSRMRGLAVGAAGTPDLTQQKHQDTPRPIQQQGQQQQDSEGGAWNIAWAKLRQQQQQHHVEVAAPSAGSSLEEQLQQLRRQQQAEQQQQAEEQQRNILTQQQQQQYTADERVTGPPLQQLPLWRQQEEEEEEQEQQQQQGQQGRRPASFEELGVAGVLLKSLKGLGLHQPTPVQVDAWPAILSGRNVAIQSPAGTGKTLSYLLPLLTRLRPWSDGRGIKPYRAKQPQILVVCPTQELCMQVLRTARALLPGGPQGAHPVVGGSSVTRCAEALKRHGPFLITATPGRLVAMISKRKVIKPPLQRPHSGLRAAAGAVTLVLEEADKLSAMSDFQDLIPLLGPPPRWRVPFDSPPLSSADYMRQVLNTYQVVLVSASMKPTTLLSAPSWVASRPLMVVSGPPTDITPAARAAAALMAQQQQQQQHDNKEEEEDSTSSSSSSSSMTDWAAAEQPELQQQQSLALPDTISHQVLCYDDEGDHHLLTKGRLKDMAAFPEYTTLTQVLRVYAAQQKKVLVFVAPGIWPQRAAKTVSRLMRKENDANKGSNSSNPRQPPDNTSSSASSSSANDSPRLWCDTPTDGDIKIGVLHGQLHGELRAVALARFNRGATQVLFTSDAFGLGLDYQGVDVVVGLGHVAPTQQAYVARAGRTGRMGQPGTVLTIIPHHRLERHVKQLRRVSTQLEELQLIRKGRDPEGLALVPHDSIRTADSKMLRRTRSGQQQHATQ